MAEEGVQDFHAAKRKATARLNLPEATHLPSNGEIQQALADYLALFHGRELPGRRRELLRVALEAMDFFQGFEPRLVGQLLAGTVTPYTEVQLQVIAEAPEEIGFLLDQHHIPHDDGEKRLRYGDRTANAPAFRFAVDDTPIEVIVLSRTDAREAPLSPIDGKPMHRANRAEVERMLGELSRSPVP